MKLITWTDVLFFPFFFFLSFSQLRLEGRQAPRHTPFSTIAFSSSPFIGSNALDSLVTSRVFQVAKYLRSSINVIHPDQLSLTYSETLAVSSTSSGFNRKASLIKPLQPPDYSCFQIAIHTLPLLHHSYLNNFFPLSQLHTVLP